MKLPRKFFALSYMLQVVAGRFGVLIKNSKTNIYGLPIVSALHAFVEMGSCSCFVRLVRIFCFDSTAGQRQIDRRVIANLNINSLR
jgi:hypothetical protein